MAKTLEDCVWLNLKNVGPLFSNLYPFISKCHLQSEKAFSGCYVALILQMKDSCSVNLTSS